MVAGGVVSATPASAAPPPISQVTLVSNAPAGPFSSGQLIEVHVAANHILNPGQRLVIEECSSPVIHGRFAHRRCDSHTIQARHLVANPDGSADYSGYPVYALPDAFALHESPRHRPVCDLTHACVIAVGWDLDDAGHIVWSLPFSMNPSAGDTGTDPGTGTPEVPFVLALPLVAAALVGGYLVIRRRRPGGSRSADPPTSAA